MSFKRKFRVKKQRGPVERERKERKHQKEKTKKMKEREREKRPGAGQKEMRVGLTWDVEKTGRRQEDDKRRGT